MGEERRMEGRFPADRLQGQYLYKYDTWFQVKPNKKEVILYLNYSCFFWFLSSPSLRPLV